MKFLWLTRALKQDEQRGNPHRPLPLSHFRLLPEEAYLSIDIPVPVLIFVLDLRYHSLALDLAESSCCPESAAG